jgi:hypothetical protein
MEYLEIKALLELNGLEREIALTLWEDGWTGNISGLIMTAVNLAEEKRK